MYHENKEVFLMDRSHASDGGDNTIICLNDHFINCQCGFTLLEVLAALAIFTAVLLGFSVWGIESWQKVVASYQRSVAVEQMAALFERLAVAGSTDQQQQYQRWQQQVQQQLPHMQSYLSCLHQYCRVELKWGKHHVLSNAALVF